MGGCTSQSLRQLLLEHCASWIEKVDLNQEMPELKFHVADTKGSLDVSGGVWLPELT